MYSRPRVFFNRASVSPLVSGDRIKNGFSAGNGALQFHYDGQCVWTIREPDLEAALRLEDFHPAIDGYLKDGASQLADLASNHVEVACRVTGELTIKGKRYEIEALGMRDHGWGERDWDTVWAHRWTVGVFDRENSFCAMSVHTSSDVIVKFGWVVRGKEVIYADETEIITYVANDGATNLGGRMLMTLSTGEKIRRTSGSRGAGCNGFSLSCCLCRYAVPDYLGQPGRSRLL